MPYKTAAAKRAYGRAYSDVHRNAISEYYSAYYAQNRERILARNRAWRQRNKGNFRSQQFYRQMLVAVLLERDGGACHVCGFPMGGDCTVEHVIPIAAGGGMIDPCNLALSHKRCNQKRPRGRWTNRGKD